MKLSRHALGLVPLLAVSLVGCAEVGPGDPSDAGYLMALFDQVREAPERVAHIGVRRLDLGYEIDGQEQTLSYLERIVTDGLGNYSLDTLEALSPVSPAFFDLQVDRAGFYFLYRDFRVRDLAAFLENYAVTDLGRPIDYLGRSAWEFEVGAKHVEAPLHYRLTLDVDTGILLSSSEIGPSGEVYSRLAYESIEFDPNLSGEVYYQPDNQETPAVLGALLDATLGFAVRPPTALPPGYHLLGITSVVDNSGSPWVKFTYTDGVEPLFFLEGKPQGPKQGVKVGPGTVLKLQETEPDTVVWSQVGPVTWLQGKFGDVTRFAVGRLPKEELFDLVESSL